MKVLINISVVKEKYRGMGVFTKNIIRKLINDEQFEYIFVSGNDIDKDLYKIIKNSRHTYVQINISLPIFEQIVVPILIKKYKPDICWFPSNTFPVVKINNIKYIATIHDLIFLKRNMQPKNFYQKIGKIYRSLNIIYGIKKLDVITSVSKTALKEINNYFQLNEIKNDFVLYNSINFNFGFDDNVMQKYDLKNKKFIYTISGDAPHKNLNFLIKSFNKFNEKYKDYFLVISGLSNKKHKLFQSKNVIFTEFISEREKNSLIKNAQLFVFASLEEGFGIPLIEALYYNSNVLASDIEIFREIGKDFVYYFDPFDEYFLLKYYKKPLKIDHDKAKKYIQNTFNIHKTVKKLKDIFNEFK